MKNLIFLFVACLAISCQNDDALVQTSTPDSSKSASDSEITGKITPQPEVWLYWHDDGGNVYGCWDDGGSCVRPAEVPNPNRYGNLTVLVNDINANPNIAYFNSNKAKLLTIISIETFDEVVKGDLTVRAKGPRNNLAYLIFTNVRANQLEFVLEVQ